MVTNFVHHHHNQNHHFFHLPKKQLITWALYALIILALLHYFLFYPIPPSKKPLPPQTQESTITVTSHLRVPPPRSQGTPPRRPPACDYADGRWVPDPAGPIYNGTSCVTIKENQNCMAHGRPDTGYLYWRWQPAQCRLPAFAPAAFLRSLRHKHLAFVGDSMARNQAESLMCLLAAASRPELVYRDSEENKFRRWTFRDYNATVSIFWSPFLVKVVEKAEAAGVRHNNVFLDAFDERWASELGAIDAVVFSIGHWFLIPSIYHEGDKTLGCHHCPEFNHTEIGFFGVFKEAVRRTLTEVNKRHGLAMPMSGWVAEKLVVVTTFSPAHFEGEWDKAGACPRKEPYREGEKEPGYTETELRKTVVEEVAAASRNAKEGLRYEVLDVTKLAMMRPDGHPGPYMYNDPFVGGTKERVQNDCVHWCMPGPIDTFNEILLQLVAR